MADSRFRMTPEQLEEAEAGHREMMEMDAVRMALQPGVTRTINGVTYILNQNHRWTLPKQGNPQQFRPAGAGNSPGRTRSATMAPPNRPQSGTGNAPRQQIAPQAAATQFHQFDVESDDNGDGITDAARVGVPAFWVPPPPKSIPRIPGLTGRARTAENEFARRFEKDPDTLTDQALDLFRRSSNPGEAVTFGTDDAKVLSPYWHTDELSQNLEQRSKNRATLNTALHQTANAITKRAFLKHLDSLPEGSEIMVTVGGCGAGKGYALKNVPEALAYKQRAAAVWDSAGDQNATENPWILQEAVKRNLKVSYVYVHADPHTQWAHPERGVVKRAQDPNDGRMVDAKVFADSYAIGAKNHDTFFKRNKSNPACSFVFLENGNPPKLLPEMPSQALQIDRAELANFAHHTVRIQKQIPAHVRRGALHGSKLWED